MKRISAIGLLILIALALLAMVFGCSKKTESYSERCDNELTQMKSPVVVIGIHNTWAGYSVTLIDGVGKVTTFGNMSSTANTIGQSRHVGDTIK